MGSSRSSFLCAEHQRTTGGGDGGGGGTTTVGGVWHSGSAPHTSCPCEYAGIEGESSISEPSGAKEKSLSPSKTQPGRACMPSSRMNTRGPVSHTWCPQN